MVIAQLNGGLGNQLFQYAAAKSLSLHKQVPLLLEISSFYREELPDLEVPRDFELYNFLGIKEATVQIPNTQSDPNFGFLKKAWFHKLLPNHLRPIYTERFYHFDANFFRSEQNVLLKGQWQSEKYFVAYKNFFEKAFELKPELVEDCEQMGVKLQSQNSVSVHVRRADYLRKQIILEWHGVMDKDYYEKAFRVLDQKLGKYHVFYFTDDPIWVEKELFPLHKGELLSGSATKNHYEDFYLMSKCRHNIVANSSFSWWSAWLNKNPEKIVVAPARWFDKGPKDSYDIVPANWIKA